MPTKNQFDFPTKKSYGILKNPVAANKRGKNQENFDSSNLNWRRRMERSVIGRTTKEKSNMVLPTHHNSMPTCAKFKEIQFVRCSAPNSWWRVPNSPEFIGFGENSSDSRAFTSSDRSIIGGAILCWAFTWLKRWGMWGKCYQGMSRTTSRNSTVITDQNWNSLLFNSAFCRNCTNFEAWLLTITFAGKFDRLIIRGVGIIILRVWNSTQNMGTLLLRARV